MKRMLIGCFSLLIWIWSNRSRWIFLLFRTMGSDKLIFIGNWALSARISANLSFRMINRHIETMFDRYFSLFGSMFFLSYIFVMIETSSQNSLLNFVTTYQIFFLCTVNHLFRAFFRDIWWFDFWFWLSNSIPKNVFAWINESKRWVFFIIQKLHFESFSFEVDDPTDFVLFF